MTLSSQPALRKYLRHCTLKQLAVFDACVRHASFSQAARACHLAQPTVSVQMKQLAEALGVQLFEPSGKTVKPTAAGLALFEECQRLFALLGEVDERLAGFRETPKAKGPHWAALPEVMPA